MLKTSNLLKLISIDLKMTLDSCQNQTLLIALVILLSGCSQARNTNPISSSAQADNFEPVFDQLKASTEVAQETCGDSLPTDAKAYPVSFYPVVMSYGEKNLELVKKHFCKDALKRFSEKTKKDVIQVGSFTSQERAKQFKDKLSHYFSGADVGTPTVVERSPQDPPKQSVAEAAKLTTQQVAELKSTVGSGKDFKTQEVVILPTDVPQGYKITHFVAWKQRFPSPRFYGGHYSIVYQNDRGACFTIDGGIAQPIGDEPTRYEEILGLSSPALGSVAIGVTEGDYASKRKSFLGFTESMNRIFRGRNEYSFQSPTLDIYSDKGYHTVNRCSRIDKKDAIRIVQSLQFLNP